MHFTLEYFFTKMFPTLPIPMQLMYCIDNLFISLKYLFLVNLLSGLLVASFYMLKYNNIIALSSMKLYSLVLAFRLKLLK